MSLALPALNTVAPHQNRHFYRICYTEVLRSRTLLRLRLSGANFFCVNFAVKKKNIINRVVLVENISSVFLLLE